MSDPDLGLCCFVSQICPGISGVLKDRYSDFIVNEIDKSGFVVHLTDVSIPQELKAVKISSEIPPPELIPQLMSRFFDSVQLDPTSQIRLSEFVTAAVEGTDSAISTILESCADKAIRAQIHRSIREHLPFLDSDTCEGGRVRIFLRSKKFTATPGAQSNAPPTEPKERTRGKRHQSGDTEKRARPRTDDSSFDARSAPWPEGRGRFLRCVLYKENRDTISAIQMISRLLKFPRNQIGFAGTKDRRACTAQHITLHKCPVEKATRVNGAFHELKLGNFTYVDSPLRLGDLKGNRFTLVLRHFHVDNEQNLAAALTSLAECGFINYYGHQRFGTGTVRSHAIGSELVRGRWTEAAELILGGAPASAPSEPPALREAKIKFFGEDGDPAELMKFYPSHCYAERALLEGLHKSGRKNYRNALFNIPRSLRNIYLHAYQSYFWNLFASERIRAGGPLAVMPGDLVLLSQAPDAEGDAMMDPDVPDLEGDDEDESKDQGAPAVEGKVVHCVTPEDVAAGRFTIFDVVIPIPGSRIIYPANPVGEFMRDLLAREGADVAIRDGPFSTLLVGDYRKLIVRPSEMEWSIQDYHNDTENISVTDLAKLHHPHPEALPPPSTSTLPKKRALRIAFSLPSSSYATMCLREILRSSTPDV